MRHSTRPERVTRATTRASSRRGGTRVAEAREGGRHGARERIADRARDELAARDAGTSARYPLVRKNLRSLVTRKIRNNASSLTRESMANVSIDGARARVRCRPRAPRTCAVCSRRSASTSPTSSMRWRTARCGTLPGGGGLRRHRLLLRRGQIRLRRAEGERHHGELGRQVRVARPDGCAARRRGRPARERPACALLQVGLLGRTPEARAPRARRGARVVGVTSDARSALADTSDVSVVLPLERELCLFDLAPVTSCAIQMLFGDTCAVAAMRARETGVDARALSRESPAGEDDATRALAVEDVMEAVHLYDASRDETTKNISFHVDSRARRRRAARTSFWSTSWCVSRAGATGACWWWIARQKRWSARSRTATCGGRWAPRRQSARVAR